MENYCEKSPLNGKNLESIFCVGTADSGSLDVQLVRKQVNI